MSNHPERQNWDDEKIALHIEGEEYDAWCSPDAEGEVFVDSEQVGRVGPSLSVPAKHGAPFPFDIVFHERYPQEGEVEELAEQLGDRFSERFDQKVSEVYEIISESDDPLDTIRNELEAADVNDT